MKKIIVLFISLTCIFAQPVTEKFSQAHKAFEDNNYSLALKLFKEINAEGKLEQQQLAAAKFFSAECFLNLDQLDAAAVEFEIFLDEYKLSNYRATALYKLGSIYFTKREYRKARERLAALTSEFPFSEFHGSSFYWMGETYASENKFVEAEENFREAIANKRTNKYVVNSIYSLAQLYEKSSSYSQAISKYDELLTYYKLSPLAPKAQLRIGVCYFYQQDYDNAILELTDSEIKFLSLDEIAEAKFFLANSHARLQEYDEASQILNELVSNVTDQQFLNRIQFSKAWIDFQQTKYIDAFTKFKSLSESSTDSLKILSLFWSGECKRYLGDSKSADTIFKNFIDKYPSHRLAAKAQLGRGSVFISQNNSADAEEALRNATISTDKQTKTKAYTMLGELRLSAKRYNDASRYFSEAIKLNPDQQDLRNRAQLGYAVSEYFLNKLSDAEKNLTELKDRDKSFESDKVNFYLAEISFASKKYSAALKHYNLIKTTDKPILRQTILGKAYTHFNMKDFANSIFFFNEYIEKHSTEKNLAEVKLRLADSYFGSKNFDKAASIYKELFSRDRLNADNDLAFYQYCQSLFKAGKTDEAKDAFEELQHKFPRSKYTDEAQYVIGWIDFQKSDYNSAIAAYRNLIKRYPHSELNPIAIYNIGDAFFNLGSYDSSIVYYSRVLEMYPNSQYVLDAVTGIQYAYVAKDQPENAISFIDSFVSANVNSKFNDQMFFKKGDLYYSIDNYNAAANIYKEFISKYPSSSLIANAYFWIGKCAANLRNETEAIKNYNLAKQRSPKSDIGISATLQLAKIYFDKKQFESAILVLDETIALNSTSNQVAEMLFTKGENESKANKKEEAVSTFEQIANYYEGTIFAAKANVELGKIMIENKNFVEAQEYLRVVSEKRLDDVGAQAQYFLGVSFFKQGSFNEAVTAFVRTRSIFSAYDEWHTKSLLMLGDCFVQLNEKTKAKEMYRAVLARNPEGEYAAEAKRKLRGL
ncbi:MAG: outer membrane assembly lipoprotein YfiO [Ignavibacteria bacterium]|nr:MAG: outer membrane assembly lipoprotein YfiO [Ignavibacteria bacterium]KAF0157275.1 MAG: outer membrane assembly lipoprotein YfiO [Ignavibacteria bacterium]